MVDGGWLGLAGWVDSDLLVRGWWFNEKTLILWVDGLLLEDS